MAYTTTAPHCTRILAPGGIFGLVEFYPTCMATAAAPAPPIAAVLPSMVSLADLQAHLVEDSSFNGSSDEAEAFAQSIINYLNKKVDANLTKDAAMADPEVEFESETDNDVDNGATTSATKIR